MKTTIQSSEEGAKAPPGQTPRPTFTIACWLMALVAFAQLISVGTALTVRHGQPQEIAKVPVPRVTTPVGPIQPRSVDQILKSYTSESLTKETAGTIAEPLRAPAAVAPSATPPAIANNTQYPSIADARVERLVQESRKLHLEGDMMRSMLKLDEAARIDPAEPAVIYQKGLLYEDMGIFTKAADHYQKIQQLGIRAGVYYRLSARKLTKGMDTWKARLNEIAIGPMKTSRAPSGKESSVTITLLARPDKPIEVGEVEVQVHFYDKLTNGEIHKALEHSEFVRKWVGSKIDWRDAGNEETLIVEYKIPQADLVDDHLLGSRQFYGSVVELLYKGKIIDQQASPSHLNSVHGNKVRPTIPPIDSGPWLPSDDEGLLPSRNGHDYGDNPAAPPLPTR
ncbi:MAG: tetratricopeptide repeat protein [Akkermansiaceae bacterium]